MFYTRKLGGDYIRGNNLRGVNIKIVFLVSVFFVLTPSMYKSNVHTQNKISWVEPATEVLTSSETEVISSNLEYNFTSTVSSCLLGMSDTLDIQTVIQEDDITQEPTYTIIKESLVPNGFSICNSNKKTYMYVSSISDEASPQFKLCFGDSAHINPYNGIMMIDDRYCVAVGTYYASEIGTKIDLVLEGGGIIKCILGDVKSDGHTDSTNRYHATDGSVAEFIVDYDTYISVRDTSGNVNWVDGFDGKIEKILIIE